MSEYRFRVSSLLLAAVTMVYAAPADAQSACGERTKFIETLAQQYQERPSAFGIAGQRNLVELFVSKSGTWTMLVTQPSGKSCIVAAGQSWEQFPATAQVTGL
ncbi:MAG: hypothetical protein ACREDX_00680 [Aestuariivirga sp.]